MKFRLFFQASFISAVLVCAVPGASTFRPSNDKLKSPRKTDTRFYTMGGAYTALVGHKLMGYYNPAAYAFHYKIEMHHRSELYEDYEDVKKARRIHRFQAPLTRFVDPINLVYLGASKGAPWTGNIKDKYKNNFFINTPSEFTWNSSLDTFSNETRQIVGQYLSQLLSSDQKAMLYNIGLNLFIPLEDNPTNTGIFSLLLPPNALNKSLDQSIYANIIYFDTKNHGVTMDNLLDVRMNTSTLNIIGPELVIPYLYINNDLTLQYSFGFKFRRPANMGLGFTTKLFNRITVDGSDASKLLKVYDLVQGGGEKITGIQTSLLDGILNNPFDMISGNINFHTNSSDVISIGNGFGFDLGWMYEPASRLYLGIMVRDLFTGIKWLDGDFEVIPINFDVGSSYSLRWNFLGMLEDPVFAIGFTDIFNMYDDPFFKHFNFGLEFGTFFNWLKFRFGLHQGFLSYSIRYDFNYRLLRKLPFIKHFFPRKMFKPVWWPKPWNYEGLLNFYRKNPVVWLGAWIFRLLASFNHSLEAGIYGYDAWNHFGSMQKYNFILTYRHEYIF